MCEHIWTRKRDHVSPASHREHRGGTFSVVYLVFAGAVVLTALRAPSLVKSGKKSMRPDATRTVKVQVGKERERGGGVGVSSPHVWI